MRLWNFLSMRVKLITLTIGSVTICSTALIFALERISETALTNQIVSNLSALVNSKGTELETELKDLQLQVFSLSNSKFVQDALVSYESVAYGTGVDLEADSDISNSSYFKTIETKYKESLEDNLQALPLEAFALAMNSGFVVSETGRSLLLGKNLKNGALKSSHLSECFNSAIKNGSYMTPVSTIGNFSGFFICQKIISKYDRDGYQKNASMGVLIATVKWSLLSNLAQFEQGLGKTGQIFVSDENILISPTRDLKNMTSLNSLIEKKLNFKLNYTESNYGIGTGFQNEEIIFVTHSIQPSPINTWKVIGQISKAEAFESIHNLIQWSIFILLIGLTLTSTISFLIINSLSKTFTKSSESIVHATDDVSTAVAEISEVANKVTSSTQQQSSALDETASAMEEINSMVKKTMELSKSTAGNAISCSSKASEGSRLMGNMVQGVSNLGESINSSLTDIKNSSGGALMNALNAFITIEEKTKVINEIAFQTKLLSFNASVEAARAGEHGKGFAVVAEEVGKLANSVNNSAKEIDDYLNATSENLKEAIDSSKKQIENSIVHSAEKVSDTRKIAAEGLDFFNDLAELIQTIQTESSAVSTAAEEQSKGVFEINKAISEITQSNSANANQIQNLQKLSNSLFETAQELRTASAQMDEVLKGQMQKPLETENKSASKGINDISLNHAS
jgi:methyl-accepting chemotaxis protein